MVNYQQAKIYKLVNDTNNDVYYGSTCRRLTQRLSDHKRDIERGSSITSRKIFEGGNVSIMLVEAYPCNNKDELNARERFYIDNHHCVNKNIPGRTHQEYREANREQIKQYNQQYHKIKKDHCKKYREANKEQLKQYHKQWYEANKESIRVVCSVLIVCDICGASASKSNFLRHQKTRKCLEAQKIIDFLMVFW